MAINNKPTDKPEWIPDNTTNITDPGSKATNGWLTGDTAPSEAFNWFWNRTSQWIDYLDSLNSFVADYTISVTDTTTLNSAITEIGTLPKNLNGYTFTLELADGTYTPSATLDFEGFYNGNIVVTRSGSGTVVIDAGTIRVLTLTDLKTYFIIDNITLQSDITTTDIIEIIRCDLVRFSTCVIQNDGTTVNSEGVDVTDSKVTFSSCGFDVTSTAYHIRNLRSDVVMTLCTNANGSNNYISTGSLRSNMPVSAPDSFTISGAGSYINDCEYLLLTDLLIITAGQVNDISSLEPGSTLYVLKAGVPPTDEATIRVLKVEGARVYYVKTSGSSPSGDWDSLSNGNATATNADATLYIGNISATGASAYVTFNESI